MIGLGEFFLHEDDQGWFRVLSVVVMAIGLAVIAAIGVWNRHSDSENESDESAEIKRKLPHLSGVKPEDRR